jgi:hypothetical protein
MRRETLEYQETFTDYHQISEEPHASQTFIAVLVLWNAFLTRWFVIRFPIVVQKPESDTARTEAS